MELHLCLLCEDARPDPLGRLDITGVFNELYAPGFPATQDRMVLVVTIGWAHEDHGRFQFRVDLKGPSGQPCLTVEGHSDVDARPADRPPPRTQLVMPLEGVIFPEPGRYDLSIQVKGRRMSGPPLYVQAAPTSEPASA
jgi:hypothetical protein